MPTTVVNSEQSMATRRGFSTCTVGEASASVSTESSSVKHLPLFFFFFVKSEYITKLNTDKENTRRTQCSKI